MFLHITTILSKITEEISDDLSIKKVQNFSIGIPEIPLYKGNNRNSSQRTKVLEERDCPRNMSILGTCMSSAIMHTNFVISFESVTIQNYGLGGGGGGAHVTN